MINKKQTNTKKLNLLPVMCEAIEHDATDFNTIMIQ